MLAGCCKRCLSACAAVARAWWLGAVECSRACKDPSQQQACGGHAHLGLAIAGDLQPSGARVHAWPGSREAGRSGWTQPRGSSSSSRGGDDGGIAIAKAVGVGHRHVSVSDTRQISSTQVAESGTAASAQGARRTRVKNGHHRAAPVILRVALQEPGGRQAGGQDVGGKAGESGGSETVFVDWRRTHAHTHTRAHTCCCCG